MRLVAALAGAALCCAALTGCAASRPSAGSVASAPLPPTTATAQSPEPVLPTGTPGAPAPAPPAADTTPLPVRLTVASIGVSTSLESLGLTADGSLQKPSQWQQAGWYAGGVRPGEQGPAVIAGHVDSVSGPAVFYRLRQLTAGATATVTRQDGSVLTFVVDTVAEYPKNAFPTAAVYGPTSTPVLRLITCTGDFDRKAKSYVDNLVVSLHLLA